MRSYEFTARTIEKAIKIGLETLGKSQEEVDIKIINDGGLFKKAKVVINIEDEPVKTNFAKPAEPKQEVKPEIKIETKMVQAKVEEKQPVQEVKKEVKLEKETEKTETPQNTSNKEAIAPVEKKKRERNANNTTSKKFVEGLLDAMKITATVELKECRENSSIKILTEDAGSVIGYRGDCLNGIQYLANVIEQRHNRDAKRVVVDAGGYKEKREESLRALAIRVAGKVESTGKSHKFEPMNAYERRIIHTELQNYSSVETHSEGEEPNRRLIVTKKAK